MTFPASRDISQECLMAIQCYAVAAAAAPPRLRPSSSLYHLCTNGILTEFLICWKASHLSLAVTAHNDDDDVRKSIPLDRSSPPEKKMPF